MPHNFAFLSSLVLPFYIPTASMGLYLIPSLCVLFLMLFLTSLSVPDILCIPFYFIIFTQQLSLLLPSPILVYFVFSCAAVIVLRLSPSRRPVTTLQKLTAAGHGTKRYQTEFWPVNRWKTFTWKTVLEMGHKPIKMKFRKLGRWYEVDGMPCRLESRVQAFFWNFEIITSIYEHAWYHIPGESSPNYSDVKSHVVGTG